MKPIAAVLTCALLALSCTDNGIGPEDRAFNFSLHYGVAARNRVDTFNDTFTKDLVLDGTAEVKLVLTPEEINMIKSTLLEVDIFSYPDTFIAEHGDTVGVASPFVTYLLTLTLDSRKKVVFWEDSLVSSDVRAEKLRQAFQSIRSLIESKPEYRQLPPARGGYM
jgi:hypothetical protein